VVQNLLLKTPYKFKKSDGGAPDPQTAYDSDAPWLRRPSLKKNKFHRSSRVRENRNWPMANPLVADGQPPKKYGFCTKFRQFFFVIAFPAQL
jgi:hypothetical protein